MTGTFTKLILLTALVSIQACTSISSNVSGDVVQVEFEGAQSDELMIETVKQEIQDYCKTDDQAKILDYKAIESSRQQYYYEDIWALIKGDKSYPYEHFYTVDPSTQKIIEGRRHSYKTFFIVDARFSCS